MFDTYELELSWISLPYAQVESWFGKYSVGSYKNVLGKLFDDIDSSD